MEQAEPDLSVMWQGNRLYKSMERQRNICCLLYTSRFVVPVSQFLRRYAREGLIEFFLRDLCRAGCVSRFSVCLLYTSDHLLPFQPLRLCQRFALLFRFPRFGSSFVLFRRLILCLFHINKVLRDCLFPPGSAVPPVRRVPFPCVSRRFCRCHRRLCPLPTSPVWT